MRFADIWLVIGTRPEAIKLSPVARALAERGLAPTIVLTGQHPALDLAGHGLGDADVRRLGCGGMANPYDHARRVEERVRAELRDPPDLLVVQGDTSSAYGAAHAAFATGVPVAHVEAGLRTRDPRSPWPEEEFRAAIDARAHLLFAPTDTASANLAEERIAGTVYVTGNSGVDALVEQVAALPPPTLRERSLPQLLVTCHRRESWGDGLEEIATAIAAIAVTRRAEITVVLHPNPVAAAPLRARLAGLAGVTLIAPLSHSGLIERMRDSDLILTDSGGIQEEAPSLGVPVLVLRDKTERPEAIASGNARLVGTQSARIVGEVLGLIDSPAALAAMARRSFPFGDGRSSPRIAAIIERWLKRGRDVRSAHARGRW